MELNKKEIKKIVLSKTDYILWLECPENAWVKIHRPEEYAKFEVSEFEKSLAEQGNKVEELARGIFPGGYLIKGRSKKAQELTKKLIAEQRPVIFQAVFTNNKYLVATDVLEWNDSAQKYDLYEIKMSAAERNGNGDENGQSKRVDKKKEEQYEKDIAFQANVLKLCGVSINKRYLIRLNKEYVRDGDLDFAPNRLFIIEDKTEKMKTLEPLVKDEMEKAYRYLFEQETEPKGCSCYYKGRISHCSAFSHLNPLVPKYSVHDLNRIGNNKKYLKELLDEGILKIDDVPIDERLKPNKEQNGEKDSKVRKLNQVLAHQSQKPIIDIKSIKSELNSLVFPLYFLDYETYPDAIPTYDRYHPYQQVVFQYSLHILKDEKSEPIHFEKLVLDKEPSEDIAKDLRKQVGDVGTIISWYKTFENSRNRELAKLVPDYKDFFFNLITRTYDLMDIVDKQYYVHPGFEGRSSIKKVLPVLAPHLSYKSFEVQSGTDAIEAYRQITEGEITGDARRKKEKEMLEYCKLDTYAMYLIWRYFYNLVKN